MEFIINQQDLSLILQIISRSVSQKPHLPILSNILFEAKNGVLKLQATNLEIGTTITLHNKIKKEGKITIPAKIINEFISSLPQGEILIEENENSVNLNSGKFQARISTTPPDEFPAVPTSQNQPDLKIDSTVFQKALDQVIFAAAAEEGRPVLAGVLFNFKNNELEMVATDGYRLSFKRIPQKSKIDSKIIIPAKSLVEVSKIISEVGAKDEKIDLILSREQNQIIFKISNIEIVSRLIEGEFPDWEKIVPHAFEIKSQIDREEFLKAVKITSVFARDSSSVIKLKIGGKSIILSANTKEVGDNISEVDAKTTGGEGEIAFNYRYLIDILGEMDSKEVNFNMIGPLNPGMFRDEDKTGDFFHIIMPVRLQS
jgi:DNA polymerase-3 subunit beta